MSFSRFLIFGCLAFVFGIITGSLFDDNVFVLAGAFIFVLSALKFWRSGPFFSLNFPAFSIWMVLSAAVFGLGVYKFQNEARIFQGQVGEIGRYLNQETKLVGVVGEEPRKKVSSRLYVLNLETIDSSGGRTSAVHSRIIVYLPLYPEFHLGDRLSVKGKLNIPESEEFDWRGYLAKDKVSAALSFPKSVEKLADDVFCESRTIYCLAYRAKSKLIFTRKNFEKTVLTSLPPPEGTIAGALMLGDNSFYLNQEWREKMNFTGTRHLVAISGSNIMLVGNIIFAALITLGFWRSRAMWLVIAGIFAFVFFVGSPASAVRAGIMGGILIFAQGIGRPAVGARLLTIAAALMLFQNPFLFSFDIGFQLSFAAVLGLIYIQPILAGYFLWLEKIPLVKNAGTMTLAAQIATLPVSLYHFGTFSLVAPLANLILVPLITALTAYSFFWVLLGFLSPALALIFSFPSWITMRFFTGVVDFFSGFSFAALEMENFPLWVALLIGFAIIAFTYKFSEKRAI